MVLINTFEKIDLENLVGPLNDIEKKYSPKKLFCAGNKQLLKSARKISIIGTRKPSKKGLENTQKITEFLVKHQTTIVSGLAKGIDTTAHKTAIQNEGKTIAVLGTPLNKFYPIENKELQQEIMQDHLAISQFEENTPVYPTNFPARNRVMALISDASIIIEAGEKSGTTHQGWEALRLGRELFILEDVVNDKNLTWPKKLLDYGAKILKINDLSVLLDNLPELIENTENAEGNIVC